MTLLKPVVLSIFLLASCNKQRTFSVTVGPSYAGTVSLSCASSADSDTQVQIGDTGTGSVACRPKPLTSTSSEVEERLPHMTLPGSSPATTSSPESGSQSDK